VVPAIPTPLPVNLGDDGHPGTAAPTRACHGLGRCVVHDWKTQIKPGRVITSEVAWCHDQASRGPARGHSQDIRSRAGPVLGRSLSATGSRDRHQRIANHAAERAGRVTTIPPCREGAVPKSTAIAADLPGVPPGATRRPSGTVSVDRDMNSDWARSKCPAIVRKCHGVPGTAIT